MLGELELNDLVNLVIAAVVLLGPILKGLSDSRKRAQERAQKTRPVEPSERERGSEGRRAWEALLRGEEPAPRRPAAPPSPPAAPAARERRTLRKAGAEFGAELGTPPAIEDVVRLPPERFAGPSAEGRTILTESPPLTASPPLTGTPPLTRTPPLTETPTLETARPLTESASLEGGRLSDIVAAEGGAAGRGLTAALEPTLRMLEPSISEPTERRASARRSRARFPGSGGWRGAIVAAELLAPPLALRRQHLSHVFSDQG